MHQFSGQIFDLKLKFFQTIKSFILSHHYPTLSIYLHFIDTTSRSICSTLFLPSVEIFSLRRAFISTKYLTSFYVKHAISSNPVQWFYTPKIFLTRLIKTRFWEVTELRKLLNENRGNENRFRKAEKHICISINVIREKLSTRVAESSRFRHEIYDNSKLQKLSQFIYGRD